MSKAAIATAIALLTVMSGIVIFTGAPNSPATSAAPARATQFSLASGPLPAANPSDLGWQPPAALESQTTSNANLAGIALSSSGTGMIVWQRGGARNVLMATHFIPNGGGDGGTNWQVPQVISNSHNDIGYSYHGAVAMDASGDAMAVYYSWNDSHGYAIYATLYKAGVGWQAPVAIDQGYDYAYAPVVAMNSVGDAVVVWQLWNGAYYSLAANRYTPGTGWGTAQSIEPTANNTYGQDVAIDGAGNAIASWYEVDGGTLHVYGARFSTSGGWLAPLLLETTTNYAFQPAVAMDAAGNGFVAWTEYDGKYQVWAKRYDHAAGWAVATTIESQPNSAAYSSVDVTASNGNASVVWTQPDATGTTQVFLNKYSTGAGWGAEADVDGTTLPADNGRGAMDPSGNVTVTYVIHLASTNPANQIENTATRFDHLTSTWSYTQLDYARVGAGAPLVAIDGKGGALTVWNYNDNTDPTTAARNGLLTNYYTTASGWQRVYQDQKAEWDEQISPSWLQLETNVAGDAIFSFTQNDGPISDGYAVLYTPGSGWGAMTRIENFNASGVTEEWSAIDGAGNAMVLFRASNNGTQYNVYAAYYSVGRGWGTPQRVDNAGGSNKFWLRIAMNERGDAVAAWQEYNGTAWIADAAFWSGTSHTWGAPTAIQTIYNDLQSVTVGIDGSGNAIAVYNLWNGTAYLNAASYYRPGSGWGASTVISHQPWSPGTGYAVAMNEAGYAAVSWGDTEGSRGVAVASVYSPVTGWSPDTIFSSGPGTEGPATPSLDSAGNAMFSYNIWDGVQYDAYVVIKPAASAWGTPTRLSSGSGDVGQLVTAQDSHGNGFAVWNQYNGYGYDIVARRYVSGVGWLAPTTVNLPAPATPSTDTGSPVLGVDGHGNAILGWNEWLNGALLPFASTYVVGNGLPALTLTSPSDGAFSSNPSVLVAGTTDPGVTVTINGVQVPVASNGSFSKAFLLTDGSKSFVVVATDTAGLSTSSTVTVTIGGPTLTVTSPSVGLTNRSAVVVSGTTESWANVTVDGTAVAVGPSGAFSTTLTLADGAHTIAVVAADAAGNQATVSVQVTVDTMPPPLTITSPTGGTHVSTPEVTVTGTAEPGSSLVVDGYAVAVSSSGAFSVALPLSSGANTITATEKDAAGNTASQSVVVTYDNPLPAAQSMISSLNTMVLVLIGLVVASLALGVFGALRGRKAKGGPTTEWKEHPPEKPSP